MRFENSKNLAEAELLDERAGQGTLRVTFKNKAVYDYADVPRVIFDGLCRADSAGAFFASMIKNEFVSSRVS